MADHDGHTINVGPVTVGVDTDAIRANYCSGQRRANWEAYIFGDVAALCDEVDRLRAALEAASAHAVEASDYADRYKAENDRLRDLLAKALPWIDPNDSHEDYLLTVAIREALGEES